MEYLALLAKIVAIADEIRGNMKAKGEEAAKQFEEAVARNKKDFGSMVTDLGGTLEPPRPIPTPDPGIPAPPDPPPVEPPPPVVNPTTAEYYKPFVGSEPTVPPYKTGDHLYQRVGSASWQVGPASDVVGVGNAWRYVKDLA